MTSTSIARTTLVCTWLFTALATVSIVIQAFHMYKRRSVGLDDYILFLAFGISILLVAQTTWAVVDEGQGVPESELLNHPHGSFTIVSKSVFANEILWGCVNTLLRVSALILSRKVFGVVYWARLLTMTGIFLSVALGIVLLLTSLLLCRPISAAWNPYSSCNEVPSYVALEAIGLGLDISILAFPIIPIWKLYLPFKQKFRILLSFSVGGLVVVVTALRLKELHLVSSSDLTYGKGYLSLLSNVGALIGIIGCCGPALSALFIRYNVIQRTATRVGSIYNVAASFFERRHPSPSLANILSISSPYSSSYLTPPEVMHSDTVDEKASPVPDVQSAEPDCPPPTEVHSTEQDATLYACSADDKLESTEEIDIADYENKEGKDSI